jgi:hypothetical protein
MTSMIGADADSLDALSHELESCASRVRAGSARLSSALGAAPWSGSDADAFRHRWAQDHRPCIAAAASFLDEASSALRRNAEEQRSASAASAAGAPGGTGRIGAEDLSAFDPVRAAFDAAGIDEAAWDPAAGVDGNRATIEAVYEYYAQLYRDHPELMWAGMAAMIGPSFYAGFADLDQFADVVSLAKVIVANGPLLAALPAPLAESLRQLARLSGEQIEAEFRWYERRFLSMQKEIFLDQAPMHEAYLRDGLEGIRALRERGALDERTLRAWEQIDEGRRTGDQSLIESGNRTLLWREQHDVIRDDYDAMYRRGTGPAVTYLATMIGAPSIPGARSYPEVFPLSVDLGGPESVEVRTPSFGFLPTAGASVPNPAHGHLELVTPLADGNIGHFDDRWRLIESDTLPAYLDMTRSERLDTLSEPVGDRMQDYRFHRRLDDLAEQLTRWEVRRR